MSAILILIIALALLACGYIFYGSFLAKKWGVDPNRETPAHTSYDGKDFVPANPAVLMGHHFSSIAGAGPINGPIQAAIFGWVPVFLWIVIGGIFFGAMHDFGALFASIRHNGGSIGEVIKDSMGVKAQRLFTIFALLVLILVIALSLPSPQLSPVPSSPLRRMVSPQFLCSPSVVLTSAATLLPQLPLCSLSLSPLSSASSSTARTAR